ncbi:glycosyltransferase family 4 protein [Erythrobacter sp. JK5]|uniref:glycosyltransferase family 4 protein n=1 Tax=Erythrobacter sp. JK5 TaxID=2829500 RepID=UPI001BA89C34|nr:glycosyltransferase family 4 protein [Erythrobacter sp. JK5]QUL39193.1 glycosyltransferase family 4 protein [Erythrobacter sp. JK5]
MSDGSGGPPRVLHCHSTFSAGGKELRAVQLMNAFGPALHHTVISGTPGETGAREYIDRAVDVRFPQDFPALKGLPTPGRLVRIAEALKPFDLILTYNWGAMDVVMAHTVFGKQFGLAPLIHHEDGFNEDEAGELKLRRNVYRRIALTGATSLVVPSRLLERIALTRWKQPPERIKRIPNGIDITRFGREPEPGALRVIKRAGEFWIGTLAGLRPVKQLPMLVEACAGLPESWHLVILGEGPERDAIRERAVAADISHRVHLPGVVNDPARVIGLFDIFALSSKSEQFPLSVVEAMAAGLPVVAPDVGDIKAMVSEANRPFIAVPDSALALASMLEELAGDAAVRRDVGAANRIRATEHFDKAAMIARYRALYSDALGREI